MTLLEQLDRMLLRPKAWHLGAYSMSALLVREGTTFRCFELHGGVAGVSPTDDRPAERGAQLFEAHGVDDLVTRLLEVWDFGTLLAPDERLYARVDIDRTRWLPAVRQVRPELSLGDAARLVDGPLDADAARAVARAARALGVTVAWRGARVKLRHEVVITALPSSVPPKLAESLAIRLRVSALVAGDLLRRPPPIAIEMKDGDTARSFCQVCEQYGVAAEARAHVQGEISR